LRDNMDPLKLGVSLILVAVGILLVSYYCTQPGVNCPWEPQPTPTPIPSPTPSPTPTPTPTPPPTPPPTGTAKYVGSYFEAERGVVLTPEQLPEGSILPQK